jgi:hypothetical protein
MIDYEGQKFLGVVKLSGLPHVSETPLRYLELMCGYYTRGFPRYAEADEKSRHLFVGIGLNLSETVLRPLARSHGGPFEFLDLASRYFQSPLYLASERVSRVPR